MTWLCRGLTQLSSALQCRKPWAPTCWGSSRALCREHPPPVNVKVTRWNNRALRSFCIGWVSPQLPQVTWEDAHERVGATGTPMTAVETNPTISGVFAGIQVLLPCSCAENVSSSCVRWSTAEDGLYLYTADRSFWKYNLWKPYAFGEGQKREDNKEKEKEKALEVCKDKKPGLLTLVQAPSKPRDTGGYPCDHGHSGPECFVPSWAPWEARSGFRGDPCIPAGRGEGRLPWSGATSLLHHCAGLCWDWDWTRSQTWQHCTFGWREFSVWAMISAQVSCFTVSSYKAGVTVDYSPGDSWEQISKELWDVLTRRLGEQRGRR